MTPTDAGLALMAPDDACAEIVLPFLPWSTQGATAASSPDALVAAAGLHLSAHRLVAVLLVRRGGYACAVVDGGAVTASKVGTRYVQSRTAAGGWSQQRFARRRANQADELTGAVAEHAVRLLVPAMAVRTAVAGGRWLATGGDRPLVEAVLGDPRLRILAQLPRGPHLQIGDPKSATVQNLPVALTSLTIHLTDPPPSR